MADLANLRRVHRRGDFFIFLTMLVGFLLFISDWGIRAWLAGLGLLLHAGIYSALSRRSSELIEYLDALFEKSN